MFTTRLRVSDITKPMINQIVTPSAQNLQKLEVARRAAAQVNLRRNLGDQAQDVTQKAAAAIFNRGVAAPQVSVSCRAINNSPRRTARYPDLVFAAPVVVNWKMIVRFAIHDTLIDLFSRDLQIATVMI